MICTQSADGLFVEPALEEFMRMLEVRDSVGWKHAGRLPDMMEKLGGMVSLSGDAIKRLRLLGRFHDIGKAGIPSRILLKPGPLTGEEFLQMSRHCQIGYGIAMSFPCLAPIAGSILKHHEWWNGEGYPLGLRNKQIPLECRILAIADAYDAMTNHRPYRQAMSSEEAAEELKKWSGIQFDPELVPLFLQLMEKNLLSL